MARKRSKRTTAHPNFVLWTKESQQRFDAALAKQCDLVDKVVQLEKSIAFEERQSTALTVQLAAAVAELTHQVEKLCNRSSAASKANATRKQAKAAAEPAGPELPAASQLDKLQADAAEETMQMAEEFNRLYGHMPENGDGRTPLPVLTPDEVFTQMKGG